MLKAEQITKVEDLVISGVEAKKGATRFLVAHFGNGDEDDQRLL